MKHVLKHPWHIPEGGADQGTPRSPTHRHTAEAGGTHSTHPPSGPHPGPHPGAIPARAPAAPAPPPGPGRAAMDLAPDLARTAAAELGETPEHRDRCLVRVKEELLKAPEEARPARMDDAYILRFLRSRKFDVPKALRVLLYRAFYDRHHPHLVRDLRAEEFRDFYKQVRAWGGRSEGALTRVRPGLHPLRTGVSCRASCACCRVTTSRAA